MAAPPAHDPPLLGCIADDFTGGTDLCNTLVNEGMHTVQLVGVPDETFDTPPADALVVALKSRTAPVDEAVKESLRALHWLRASGVEQYLFKYCSTFDSTEEGNIGPVADALMDALDTDLTIVCPAFPENGRTVYMGHHFVGDVLLSESSMADHPLTPMTDPNLVRFLGRQTPNAVGLVAYPAVHSGPSAIRERLDELRGNGVRHAVTDALDDAHLRDLGSACAGLPLVTGGSGIARGLPDNFRQQGRLSEREPTADFRAPEGPAIILAGSSSEATREQVAQVEGGMAAWQIDPIELAVSDGYLVDLIGWVEEQLGSSPLLIYATAPPHDVKQVQEQLGQDRASEAIEGALADIARAAVDAGARRLIIAGGESAAAVVQALDVQALEIGPEIAPGVPWTLGLGSGEDVALALKSGNFGAPTFFNDALEALP